MDSDRAIALKPLSKDALLGGDILFYRALTLAELSRHEEAIAILEQLLSVPSTLSRNLARLHPSFAQLRTNPRFQRLVGG